MHKFWMYVKEIFHALHGSILDQNPKATSKILIGKDENLKILKEF